MVIHCRFVSVRDASGMADYFMRETQPRHERDMDREAMRLPGPGEHDGTVPELRRDIPEAAARAFRLTPGQTPTHDETENIIRGLRADGGPTGKRITAGYERGDGREFKQKQFVEIRVSWDTSVSLSIANAETQGGRALIMSSLHNAAHQTMRQASEHLGWTRLGAGGKGGEERGQIAWIGFAHHTTQPDKQGNVWPNYHIHFIIPNGVVSPSSGKVRAIHMQKMLGFGGHLSRSLQDNTAVEFKRIGFDFKRADGNLKQVIASSVPENIRAQFIKRSLEMADFAKRKAGIDNEKWKQMPAKMRDHLMQQARNLTRTAKADGMANRPAWRERMHAGGMRSSDPIGISWLAGTASTVMTQTRHLVLDLARPVDVPTMALPERAQRLAQAVQQTRMASDMIHQQREQRGLWRPSVARVAAISRALVPAMARQALRMRQTLEAIQRQPERALRAGRALRDMAIARSQAIRQAMTMHRRAEAMTHQTIKLGLGDRVHVDDAAGRYQVAVTMAPKAGDTSSAAERTVYHGSAFADRRLAEALAAKIQAAGSITQDRWKAQTYNATPRPGPDAEERMVRVYARRVAAGDMPMSQAVDTMARLEERRERPTSTNPVHHTATYAPGAATADNRDQREAKWQTRIGDAVEKIHAGTAWQDTQKAPTPEVPAPRMRMER